MAPHVLPPADLRLYEQSPVRRPPRQGTPDGSNNTAILIGVFVGLAAIGVILAIITIAIRRRRRSAGERLIPSVRAVHSSQNHARTMQMHADATNSIAMMNMAVTMSNVNASIAASQPPSAPPPANCGPTGC
ncbi:hypothetical protein OH76DRAFT_1241731 [Lentinus brumalis]|uniref:Uncharacterized protein n=1 Tax=Lentinus brumalis TaxID=2498619 RepID=A0A371CSB5_9APHY|nr:hypothetical protein OH76DRAFT_1241731 [Polyporus brumalis]